MPTTPLIAPPPAQLCVLRLSALGDVCHVLPVVRTDAGCMAGDAHHVGHRQARAQIARSCARYRIRGLRQATRPRRLRDAAQDDERTPFRRSAAHAAGTAREHRSPHWCLRASRSVSIGLVPANSSGCSRTPASHRARANTCSTACSDSPDASVCTRVPCAGTFRCPTPRRSMPFVRFRTPASRPW